MKKTIQILTALFILANAMWALAGPEPRQRVREGMQGLGAKKGNRHLCVLTNATYVKLKKKTGHGYVDMIQEETGCSIGKGNLLFFQRPVTYPLMIAIHKEDSGDARIIVHDGEESETFHFNIKGDSAADPKTFGKIMKMLKGDTFSVVTTLTAHARGVPYDFLKCCEHHNHYCPGVTSGYFIANLIQKRYPAKKGQKHIWFACPLKS